MATRDNSTRRAAAEGAAFATPSAGMRRRRREAIEALIDRAIAALDVLDGDCDLEEEQDCCEAADDDLSRFPCRQRQNDHGAGTLEDAEPDEDDLGANEDEFPSRSLAATNWHCRNGKDYIYGHDRLLSSYSGRGTAA
ncbi:hypothetical protein EJV46_16065 [Roseococcus sp. SYP-B2431]|uniref:hypothetical protein n=1 Tax=Roseococcus sp. SYP-B2431 TaxID=2496640 RepID=UPI00103B2C22|nr:hypothetical protein [Roseococcus sp. SYP-B2431]TCH97633.1 hypothetical protein EJV46_16065 [Roseococcus sp. SYP-B2431]